MLVDLKNLIAKYLSALASFAVGVWLLTLFVTAPVLAQNEDDLLAPEQAFTFTSNWQGNTLIARWEIADGYYMYKDKFAVESQTEGIEFADFVMSPGVVKNDPFFGETVIYNQRAEIKVPLIVDTFINGAAIDVWGQGCNEPVGICYPPTRFSVFNPLTLVPEANAQAAQNPAPSLSLDNLLSDLPSVTEDELLSVDQAFRLELSDVDGERLLASFKVEKGYYLYQDKVSFEIKGDAQISNPILPIGERTTDAFFGDVEIYTSDFEVMLPLVRASPNASNIDVVATYQGCAKDLICYPPTTKTFNIALPNLISSASAASRDASADDYGSSSVQGIGFWWLVISAFGTGLLLTFTPCVLPLIPILSSIVIGQSKDNRLRAGSLSVIYVLGTVVAYAGVGAVAGATGDQLQAYFQNAWAISLMSAVFVLMSLSLFGFFEIRLPSFVETRIQERSHRIGGGKFGAVFSLGVLSALIVSACVSPLLISALGIAIARADPYLGAAMMTSMALGMGAILIAIGFGVGVVLPKAGIWMDSLKQAIGIVLLGVAIYILGSLPQVPVLLLWGALFVVTGVYLGATQQLPENASGWHHFWKGIGIVLLVWGILALVGGMLGNRDILQPLPVASAFSHSSNILA